MTGRLVEGRRLTDTLPACIPAVFTSGAFTHVVEDRGRVSLFERFEEPAVFIESVLTKKGAVRGNHVHHKGSEALNVISGVIEYYLLCECGENHVYMKALKTGDTAVVPPGIAHALIALEDSEVVVLFSSDPRHDRDRVPIITT